MPKVSRPLGTDRPAAAPGVLQGVRAPERLPDASKSRSMEEVLQSQGILDERGPEGQANRVPAPGVAGIQDVPVDMIVVSPYQPRLAFDEAELDLLADSIQAQGGLNKPIVVRPRANGNYELIGGERRWRAHKLLHWDTIRAYVREMSDEEAEVAALADNEGQKELSEFERGRRYAGMLESGRAESARALGRLLGVSSATMTRCLGYMQLPAEIIKVLERCPQAIGSKQVRAFVELSQENPDVALAAVMKIRDEDISQEAALRWARKQLDSGTAKPKVDSHKVFSGHNKVAELRVSGSKIEVQCEKGYDATKVAEAFARFLESADDDNLTINH
jgi:ParB family transcriptional regulator, chromosome partitioning protein